MDIREQRQKLKRLQAIVYNRAERDLPDVITELRAACDVIEKEIAPPARKKDKETGYDRMRRVGRNRSEA